MFVQKDLFNSRWGKSLYRSRTVENVAGSIISVEKPLPELYIIFGKKNSYYYKIVGWLQENNIENIITNVFGDAVELTIRFNF